MKEDERTANNRRFHVIAANEDNHYANSYVEGMCPQTQSTGDHKRCESDIDEPDFREELQDSEDEADLIEVDDPSETVCCICDNGGDVICCDGPCMRSFHVNKDAGGARDSDCFTLGLDKAEAERMDLFFCPNCKYKEHQCYICNKLGCSNEFAGEAQEVFLCDSAMCGHFYHADCVAKMLLKDAKNVKQESLVESIRQGKGFVCPMHKCWNCGRGEDKGIWELQFGVCRRCPRVWHRKCFPKFLRFKEADDKPQRAWEGLLSDRVLVYCIEHKIIRKLCTPARTQVVFPDHSKQVEKNKLEVKKKKRRLIKLKEKIKVVLRVEKKPTSNAAKTHTDMSSRKQKRSVAYKPREAKLGEADAVSQIRKIKQTTSCSMEISNKSKKYAENYFMNEKSSMEAGIGKPQDDENVRESKQITYVKDQEMRKVIDQRSYQLLAMPQLHRKIKQDPMKPVVVDSEMRSMIKELISKAKCLVTLESIHKKHDAPFCYKRNLNNLDKKYSKAKIESIMKGILKAAETLEGNGSMEDAKAQCAPGYLKFLEGCKNELRVFLAPFLHGARYTPFGRHFTQLDKLEQIVDRLHWYVKNGDTVVDFCCGSNDFSLLMKAKLDQMGKSCYYNNFDIIQSQHSFNFIKKDWFKVEQNELAEGSRLIMGLNPPFGVKGRLANLFIDHALKFKPKILVLIVPKETQRLDRKQNHYDLIWEDLKLLSGRSFYLPGSVDIYGKALTDWNVVAPPLSLWSRPDWTTAHKQIALEKGHIPIYYHSRMTEHSVDSNHKVQEKKRKYSMKREPRFSEATDPRIGSPDSMIIKDMPEKRSRSLHGNHGELSVDGFRQARTDVFNERHSFHDMRSRSIHEKYEQHEAGINHLRQDQQSVSVYERGGAQSVHGVHASTYYNAQLPGGTQAPSFASSDVQSGAYMNPRHSVHGVHDSTYYNDQLPGGTQAPSLASSDVQAGGNSNGFMCERHLIDSGQSAGNLRGTYVLDACARQLMDMAQSARNLRGPYAYERHPMDMAQSARKFCGIASNRNSRDRAQPARNVTGVAFERDPMDMALHPPEVSKYNYGPPGVHYTKESGYGNFTLPIPSNHGSVEHNQDTSCRQNDDYRVV